MHRIYANTMPYYVTDLSILGFWYLWGSLNQSPMDTKGQVYLLDNAVCQLLECTQQDTLQKVYMYACKCSVSASTLECLWEAIRIDERQKGGEHGRGPLLGLVKVGRTGVLIPRHCSITISEHGIAITFLESPFTYASPPGT